MASEVCALCGQLAVLCDSHIMPKFVSRWLKNTSATGPIRTTARPDKREQDGRKKRLLCDRCEQRFGRWETRFATDVFYPFQSGERAEFQYGPWLLKFVTSVSWRALTDLRPAQAPAILSAEQLRSADTALSTWREFLLDERTDPGRFQQNLLLLGDVCGGTDADLPRNINRFISRTASLSLVWRGANVAVCAKMPKICLVGFVAIGDRRRWRDTKVHVRDGTLRFEGLDLPGWFVNWLFGAARKLLASESEISGPQWEKITASYLQHAERVERSGTLQATHMDYLLFGPETFASRSTNRMTEPEEPSQE